MIATTATHTTTRSTILVVDDSKLSLRALTALLDSEGHRVLIATNSASARKVVEKVVPDMILLDVVLDEIDGFELCEELKDRPELADVPVLFITALTEQHALLRGFEVGAVDYITKPFQDGEVRARVRTHLRIRELTRELQERHDELTERTHQVTNALERIKTLSGLIPICANCKSIRKDDGFWQHIEEFLAEHSIADFSHSICPDCTEKLYPGLGSPEDPSDGNGD